MTVRLLHLLGSAVLRQRAEEVATVDEGVRELIGDLLDTMRAARGVGLAANQIGVARRVAVVEAGPGPSRDGAGEGLAHVLINPVIVEREGSVREEEGCLSIPEIFGEVERAARVVVEVLDADRAAGGACRRIEATDLVARAIQHEIDHLDGILFLDRIPPMRRRLLLNQWERSRRDAGAAGYLREIAPETAGRADRG